MKNRALLFAASAVLLLSSLSPLAADTSIRRGIDTFTTTASGETFYDFAQSPIPAGFFCRSSAPPAARAPPTAPPRAPGAPAAPQGADTVTARLDDAAFDGNGRATTRIQFRALSLVSVAPIKTGCGAFHVYVSLAGQQRVTTMLIDRTEEKGGSFSAPLAVNARMTFVPVKPGRNKAARNLELVGSFTFPASPIPWSTEGSAQAKRIGSVLVDTNGDLKPDTQLFGSSNFHPGWSPDGHMQQTKGCTTCEPRSCHEDPATLKQHCTGPVTACYPYNCP